MNVRVQGTVIYPFLRKNRVNHVGVPKTVFCTPFFSKRVSNQDFDQNSVFEVVVRWMCMVMMVNRCKIVFKGTPIGFNPEGVSR